MHSKKYKDVGFVFISRNETGNSLKKLLLLTVFVCLSHLLFAHSINYALEDAPVNEVVWFYLTLGFKHIIPSGIDHILFVAGLCLLGTNIKTIFWQATAFTVAHSITLALSMKGIIVAPGAVVEPIIALSIVFVAIENMLLTELKPWRVMVVFLFGLIHGMGFASALNEIGLPVGKFYTSVIAFNLGVELGQVAVILAMFGCIIIPFRNRSWYRKGVVYPLSALIAVVALYWTVQRIFFTG
ncbi:MAG: HupE/UreJ family protein [Ferruginibacter sp.]|nr:HupE/UreJ family protein [Ferruginibacter sp.]